MSGGRSDQGRTFLCHITPREKIGLKNIFGAKPVRLEDQFFATQVTFAEQNEPSLLGVVTLEDALLGVVTLEDALLAVDPVGQRLVPVEAERL